MYTQDYVSNEVLKDVFQTFLQLTKLQKEPPFTPVTKKQVFKMLKQKHGEKCISYKHLGRAFRKLLKDGKIKKSSRGQYWLHEYLEKNIAYLKQKIAWEKKVAEGVAVFSNLKTMELEDKLWRLEEKGDREEILKELRKKGEIP